MGYDLDPRQKGLNFSMSVNLVKGQKVNLQKSDGGTLNKVVVGLGWDEAKRGLFGPKNDIDCDASAFVCKNGRLTSNFDIVCYSNLCHGSKAVQHMGDNLTGAGDADDEQIVVDLQQLPSEYDRIVFTVNIYQAQSRKQHFGMIQNAFIRIVDADNHQELCRYNLSENYSDMTAMIFGEIYRHNGQWKFNAIGQATKDNDIRSLADHFRE